MSWIWDYFVRALNKLQGRKLETLVDEEPEGAKGWDKDWLKNTGVDEIERQKRHHEKQRSQHMSLQDNKDKKKKQQIKVFARYKEASKGCEHLSTENRLSREEKTEQRFHPSNVLDSSAEATKIHDNHCNVPPRRRVVTDTSKKAANTSSVRRKAKDISYELFKVIGASHTLTLVCPRCISVEASPVGKAKIINVNHSSCAKNLLLLKEKHTPGRDYIVLRNKQPGFVEDEGLCEGSCEQSQDCSRPHSVIEREIWTRLVRKEPGLDIFIEDLKTSRLGVQVLVDEVCQEYKGRFMTVCKECHKKKRTKNWEKRSHGPRCKNGHSWKAQLLFEKNVDGELNYISVPDLGPANDRALSIQIMKVIDECKKSGLMLENIVQEHRLLHQKLERVGCGKPITVQLPEDWSDDEYPHHKKKVFINVGDLEKEFQESTLEDVDVGYDTDDYGGKEPYYYMKRLDEIKTDGGIYRECVIHLDGPHAAICKPFVRGSAEGDIIVRGRRNCGPTFEGDHVMVEIMQQKNASSVDNCTKGRVVYITKRNSPINGNVFLCTVDNYQSNLMKPLCGSLPKIHVLDEVLKGRPDAERFRKVVVHDKDLHNIHIMTLKSETRASMLFVVKLLKWAPSHIYPLGYVCKITESAKTLEESQHVLNVIHRIQTQENEQCVNAARQLSLSNLPEMSRRFRTDLRNMVSFTIDPEDCHDMDDALSIWDGEDNNYKVAVHIADVAEFVKYGSKLDKDARKRATSYYPLNREPYHMLPKQLSQNTCSLRPEEDHLAISVILTMQPSGNLVGSADIKETVIRSTRKFTYTEVQKILDGESDPHREKLLLLHSLAQKLREKRLGDSQYWTDDKDNDGMLDDAGAHQLVEEFMILSNEQVARYFTQRGHQNVPLRIQHPPCDADLAKWKESGISSVRKYSFYFKRFNPTLGNPSHSPPKDIPVLSSTLNSILEALKADDMEQVKRLFTTESLHPLHKLAMITWFQIQEPATYQCLGCSESDWNEHFTMQCPVYIHFTSPIRRYMDIVVHRQLKAALRGRQLPHSCQELGKICSEVNKKMKLANSFSRANMLLNMTEMLYNKPMFLPGIISQTEEGIIEFVFPHLDIQRSKLRSIRCSSLSIDTKTDLENSSGLVLRWKRRIYDARGFHPQARKEVQLGSIIHLDTGLLCCGIATDVWQQIHSFIKENQDCELSSDQISLLEDLRQEQQCIPQREVTSEMADSELIVKHNCEFDITLKVGSVLPVLVGAESQHGYIQPTLKAVGLTKEFDTCIQHMTEPVQSFENIASTPTMKGTNKYKGLWEYDDIWTPILRMEAVTSAITDSEAIVVNHMHVHLDKTSTGTYKGFLKLSFDFCKKREFMVVQSVKGSGKSLVTPDYLCLRCAHEVAGKVPQKRELWIAHAKVTKGSVIKKDGQEYGKLHFYIHHYQGEASTLLKNDAMLNAAWTVEFLSVPLPSRLMLEAVKNLEEASPLLQSIAIGGHKAQSVPLRGTFKYPDDLNIKGQDLPPNNEMQNSAISTALHQDFTLIQGPPGTGKTLTGVKLVYWFFKRNRTSKVKNKPRQVMYCGPSNNSVDVAAKHMQRRLGNDCPKILRVYSEMLENLAYPVPRDTHMGKSTSKFTDTWDSQAMKNISLHHVIREPSNQFASQIAHFDELFERNRKHPKNVTDEQIQSYMTLVKKASMVELEKAEVIMCTCSVSASVRITEACNIAQCIVDECGMCMEPEVLIPLNPHRPEQIVLIGDHKQLQPIVKNDIARTLGLEISLFERYQDQAIMLTDQYRMHPAICRFPSNHFYEGKLRSPRSGYWTEGYVDIWPNRNHPTAFCHVEGAERVLTVTTTEGNEQSRMNDAEKNHVVRIFKSLTQTFFVNKKTIAVLTQYKAQCSEITRCLGEIGFKGANVSTVVASQGGEWDYVILSTVRSLPDYEIDPKPTIGWKKRNMGFIVDPHQINVALTRARKGLIIIGNKNLLECDTMWKKLLNDYIQMGSVLEAKKFPCRYVHTSK